MGPARLRATASAIASAARKQSQNSAPAPHAACTPSLPLQADLEPFLELRDSKPSHAPRAAALATLSKPTEPTPLGSAELSCPLKLTCIASLSLPADAKTQVRAQ